MTAGFYHFGRWPTFHDQAVCAISTDGAQSLRFLQEPAVSFPNGRGAVLYALQSGDGISTVCTVPQDCLICGSLAMSEYGPIISGGTVARNNSRFLS